MSTADIQKKLWNARYADGGHLWGTLPSQTVLRLTEAMDSLSNNSFRVRDIITIGSGTGRDEVHLSARSGANVVAFELASKGIELGRKFAKANNASERIDWKNQDFTKSKMRRQFDGLLSHRTLHLLDDNQVDKFAIKAAKWVKPGGILAVSARNLHDFNEEQMEWISEEDGIAQYTDPKREGHIIRFWDERKFKSVFGEAFHVSTAVTQGIEEIESVDNKDVMSSVSIFVALRKEQVSKPVRIAVPNARNAGGTWASPSTDRAARTGIPFIAGLVPHNSCG